MYIEHVYRDEIKLLLLLLLLCLFVCLPFCCFDMVYCCCVNMVVLSVKMYSVVFITKFRWKSGFLKECQGPSSALTGKKHLSHLSVNRNEQVCMFLGIGNRCSLC